MTNLLWTPFVDDARVVLRPVPVLPGQVDHQLALLLVLGGVQSSDLVLPAPRGGFPCRLPRRRRWACVSRVDAALSRPLVPGRGGVGGRAAALLVLERVLHVLEYFLSTAYALVVLV